MQPNHPPRIALIHALEESVLPARAAFAAEWPEAFCFDLLDTSLATDLQDAGSLDETIMERFQVLAHYASDYRGRGGRTQAILFTCSAFGAAIDAVKAQLLLPVLRPNESAFEEALKLGDRIAILVTFGPSRTSLEAELHAMATAHGRHITIKTILVDGALAALKSGDGATHDQLAAQACRDLGSVDALILGQFSLARAAPHIRRVTSAPVLTTPVCAVRTLKARLGHPNSSSFIRQKG
jgi:Asp/Glu/hydantoin racemase